MAAGIRLTIGTDSVVSVGDLDMFAELRETRRLAGLDAATTLGLATHRAAVALRKEHEVGSLQPGRLANLLVVNLGADPADNDIEGRILDLGVPDVVATFLGGQLVHRHPSSEISHR
jgi:5-methylthioadenosine/S-adenosylhomocysteine deaminase